MTWHMPATLRAGFLAIALLLAAAGVVVIIDDLHPAQPGYIVLGVVMIAAAANLAATGWRAALTVAGDTLTSRSAFRATKIQRAEVIGIDPSSSGLTISYTRDGRERTLTSAAGQGILNSLGGRLAHRQTRSQSIAHDVTQWWHQSI